MNSCKNKESLLEHIIKIASNENDVIFDPFMGVGSTGVAALKNNRKFIGCEIEKEYFDATLERIYKENVTNNRK